jgi:Fe-S-cluster-containing dehydrogenase component
MTDIKHCHGCYSCDEPCGREQEENPLKKQIRLNKEKEERLKKDRAKRNKGITRTLRR